MISINNTRLIFIASLVLFIASCSKDNNECNTDVDKPNYNCCQYCLFDIDKFNQFIIDDKLCNCDNEGW
jgi:hypothetical protein